MFSSDITAAPATIDDWLGIKACIARLRASRFSQYVSSTNQEAEGFFVNSRQFPDKVGFLILKWGDYVIGVVALLAIDAPKPGTIGVYTELVRHCFIHSVYIDPWIPVDPGRRIQVPMEAGKVFYAAIENWGRVRGATFIYGNVREDGHFDAFFRKFGLRVQHKVVGRVIEHGQV